MKHIIIIFFCIYNLHHVFACDCKGLSLEEGYNSSSEVVLGKIIHAEHKIYVLNKESKDSIQNHFERLVFNDTIHFVEYTVQILKNYKDTQKVSELIVRAEANGSNCDIRLELGSTYMLYGNNNWSTNLYYPKDKYYVLSSICTRTTNNWKKEQKDVEKFLRKKNKTNRNIIYSK
ncbi:MAG: hypothetical protein HRT58_20485 [Crocinitomicaceae bacterium]|nr:hypothetical protein [Flavobacteriales bacterium]NQZ38049.1 hypothetical protein [Crocinitomicaceae bacterium]